MSVLLTRNLCTVLPKLQDGYTSFLLAKVKGHDIIVDLLRDAGAKPAVCVDCSGTFTKNYFNSKPDEHYPAGRITMDITTGSGRVDNGSGIGEVPFVLITGSVNEFQSSSGENLTAKFEGGKIHWSNDSTWNS